jgi:hypothetical protein
MPDAAEHIADADRTELGEQVLNEGFIGAADRHGRSVTASSLGKKPHASAILACQLTSASGIAV